MTRTRNVAVLVACYLLAVAAVLRPASWRVPLPPAADAWLVVATGIWLQAVPFVLVGVSLAAALHAFVPAGALARLLPRNTAAAVPVAGLAGMLLPACECASVPTARQLVRSGVHPAAALTFLLSAPAVNPIVLVSTWVAFGGSTRMAAARLAASLLASVAVGIAWSRLDRDGRLLSAATLPSGSSHAHGTSKVRVFRDELIGELLPACGYLVVGAAVAATIKTAVPTSWIAAVAGHPVLEVFALAALAVLVALCSESDAFLAASMTMFSPVALLTFLTVGPMVDVKLIAMQRGAFGGAFVRRFVPLTLVCAMASAVAVGLAL